MSRRQIERERQARRELGDTRVSPGVARALAGAFLALVFAVPLLDALAGGPAPGWTRLVRGVPDACALRAFEDRLEEASAVGAALRPWLQAAQVAAGAGNAQVYVGRAGWLYQRQAVDAVAGPAFLEPAGLYRRLVRAETCGPPVQPDPVRAIAGFRDQLAARGVALVVVPTPAKVEVEPGALSPAAARAGRLPRNASFDAFVARLAEAGVDVFDPRDILARWAREHGEPAYLATDTHWRPGAMEAVARALAERVRAAAPAGALDGPQVAFARGAQSAANLGDVAALLDLPTQPDGSVLGYPLERVTLHPVTTAAAEPAAPAPVLLLGDSFSNIYARRAAFQRSGPHGPLDWGADAGLPQQLAFALGRPVDAIARNDGGAWTTRAELARQMAAAARAGRDRLADVRVVVWQFANRELPQGDWRAIELPAAPEGAAPAPSAPPPEPAGEASVVRAVVRERGPLPRAGGPYPEALFAVRLGGVRTLSGPQVEGDVVAYLVARRESGPAPAAELTAGERVELRLLPWADAGVQQRYGALRRTELDDPEALLLPAYFGELP